MAGSTRSWRQSRASGHLLMMCASKGTLLGKYSYTSDSSSIKPRTRSPPIGKIHTVMMKMQKAAIVMRPRVVRDHARSYSRLAVNRSLAAAWRFARASVHLERRSWSVGSGWSSMRGCFSISDMMFKDSDNEKMGRMCQIVGGVENVDNKEPCFATQRRLKRRRTCRETSFGPWGATTSDRDPVHIFLIVSCFYHLHFFKVLNPAITSSHGSDCHNLNLDISLVLPVSQLTQFTSPLCVDFEVTKLRIVRIQLIFKLYCYVNFAGKMHRLRVILLMVGFLQYRHTFELFEMLEEHFWLPSGLRCET